MIRIPCPWCGPRNVTEFNHHGEQTQRPDPSTTSEEEWRRYLYIRTNSNEWVDERWYHSAGCRKVFSISRNATTNDMAPASAEQTSRSTS